MDKLTLINSDVLEGLRKLPDACVQTCITSPPYYGLRNYQTDGQIGLEKTPSGYVYKLVVVFREVRRVLCDDGTLWLNLGDSYANQKSGDTYSGFNDRYFGRKTDGGKQAKTVSNANIGNLDFGDLKPKDLCGIPWRVAFALQDDGWILRQDIIWEKLNPMPESVSDRCTKAHEYIFLMAKSDKYYYDCEAVKEPAKCAGLTIKSKGNKVVVKDLRNRRSVWTLSSKRYAEAHFATFPPELPEICIKAGSRKGDTVLDPFSGAGTTGLMAIRLGRKYIGIEINPEYVEMSRKRIEGDMPLITVSE